MAKFLGEQWEVGEVITYTFNVSAIGMYEFSSRYETKFETAMAE